MTEKNDASRNLLNEHQHRALSTRLAFFDRELSAAEQLVSDRMAIGPMFEMSSDLSRLESERLLGLLGRARERIIKLRDRFDLEVQKQDVRHWLLGHFSILWSVLHDSHASKLRGFGEVSEGLLEELDPEIDELIEIISAVRRLVSSSSKLSREI